MSISAICDVCQKPIGKATDKEYYDVAIFFKEDEEIIFEDICDDCLAGLKQAIEDFKDKINEPPAPAMKHDAQTVVLPGQTVLPLIEQEPEPEPAIEEPIAVKPELPRELPERVTKTFPIPKRVAE